MGRAPLTRSALPALLPRATILAEREVRRMDYTNAMMVWDAVSVRITDVRHRLLIRLDLCQYFGQKKLKDYADFFSSSSSLCCGVI